MYKKWSRNNRSECLSGSYIYVSYYSKKMIVSKFMGILKGKSSLMIFDRFAHLKYKYGNRYFGCRGYYVDTVGRNKVAITKYIQNQIQEGQIIEQISIKEYIDPFTGTPVKGRK